MLIILDDVFQDHIVKVIADDYVIHKKTCDIFWYDITSFTNINSPVTTLLNIAAKNFNLTDIIGFEYWAHYNSGVDWHFDKDELESEKTGKLVFPECSIVYYPLIENLEGGCFITKHDSIKPKTNRAIIFSSDIEHKVDSFTGTRLSVSINPWNRKPQAHL
jgi:hypothetical protein